MTEFLIKFGPINIFLGWKLVKSGGLQKLTSKLKGHCVRERNQVYFTLFYMVFWPTLVFILAGIGAVERGGDAVFLPGSETQRGPKRAKFNSFWVIFLNFRALKCEISSNFGPYVEVWGPKEDKIKYWGAIKNFTGARPFSLQ